METISQGYIGIAEFGGLKVRCEDFGVNLQQDYQFYNHAVGLNDDVTGGGKTKGEKVGTINIQRTFFRPGVFKIEGSMSFPATEVNIPYFFNLIKTGNYIETFSFYYYCIDETKIGRKFNKVRLSNFNLEVTAGEIIKVTVGFVAKDYESATGLPDYTDSEKLLTWDMAEIIVDSTPIDTEKGLSAFSLSVDNKVEAIYTLQPDNDLNALGPHDLRLGIQEVSGTLTYYNITGLKVLPECEKPYEKGTITVTMGAFTTPINTIFLPAQVSGSSGTITTSIGFVGVDKAFGD